MDHPSWWWGWWLLGIALTLWMTRWIWGTSVDIEYLQSFFDRSQWRIPLSEHVIADSELYLVAGWRLVTRHDFYQTNPEVPPVGKYLYGLTMMATGQPYLVTVSLYLVAILSFGWFVHQWLPKPAARLATGWWIWSGLLSWQVSQTMLDLPQVVFLLWHVIMIGLALKTTSRKQHLLAFGGAGVTLGLFAATKIGLFVPLVLLADTWFALITGQWWAVGVIGLLSGFTYLVSYADFLRQNTILDWLKAQKWMLNFYAASKLKPIPGMAVITSLTGWYRGWWQTQGWQFVQDWNVLWSLGVLSWLVGIKKWQWRVSARQPETVMAHYVLLLGGLIFVSMCVIPFWPRYFLLVLPFGIYWLAKIIAPYPKLSWVVTGIVVMQWFVSMAPNPTERLHFIIDGWQQEHWAELYSLTDPQFQKQVSRAEFYRTWSSSPAIPKTATLTSALTPWQTHASAELVFPTITGEVRTQILLTRVGNQWFWSIPVETLSPTVVQ